MNTTGGIGGGIGLDGAFDVHIANNLIDSNRAAAGGGIAIINASEAVVVQNVVTNNVATRGGGLLIDTPSLAPLMIVNNTVADKQRPRARNCSRGASAHRSVLE